METQLQLCTFEQAQQLKQLGFDWETLGLYNKNGILIYLKLSLTNWNHKSYPDFYSCPTIALALMWLREVKRVELSIVMTHTSASHYYMMTPVIKGLCGTITSVSYKTYSEVESAALDAALEFLFKQEKAGQQHSR